MKPMELTIEQALENLKIACDSFVGTKQQHVSLQYSLQKITSEIFNKHKPKAMTTSIADLRAAANAALDVQAATLGENTVLTNQADIDEVSHALDAANETWNENLPTRPTS